MDNKDKNIEPDVGGRIINECIRRYSSYETYQDEGRVLDVDGGGKTLIVFRTFFKRPNLFRFEFANPSNGSDKATLYRKVIVGFDGTQNYFGVYDPQEPLEIEYHKNLSTVVACGTGLSFGAAHTISSLLFPFEGGFKLSQLRAVKIQGYEKIGIDKCWKVFGAHPSNLGNRLFIEENSFRLLKYESKGLSSHEWISEVHENVIINTEIPTSVFKLDIKKSLLSLNWKM